MSKLKDLFKTFFGSKEKTIVDHETRILNEKIDFEFKTNLVKFKETLNKSVDDKTIESLQEAFCGMIPLFEKYKTDSLFKSESKLALAINELDKDKIKDQITGINAILVDVIKSLSQTHAKPLLESELSAVADEMVEVEEPTKEPEEIGTVNTAIATPEELKIPEKSALEIGFEDGRKYYQEMREKGLKPNNFSRHLAETHHAERTYKWVENWIKGFNEGIKFHETVQRDLHPELFEDENEDPTK